MEKAISLPQWLAAHRALRARVAGGHETVHRLAGTADEVALFTGFSAADVFLFSAGITCSFHSWLLVC
jgi:hypothetical protein